MQINIGMTDEQRQNIANGLAKLLANSYSLYMKTQNYHWNVVGSHFTSLHAMFEQQYTELSEAVDTIAERIRALGHLAPASYREFTELSEVSDGNNRLSDREMVQDLLNGQEIIVRTCRALVPVVDEANDDPTSDLLSDRMQIHEKNAWMLRAFLEQ